MSGLFYFMTKDSVYHITRSTETIYYPRFKRVVNALCCRNREVIVFDGMFTEAEPDSLRCPDCFRVCAAFDGSEGQSQKEAE